MCCCLLIIIILIVLAIGLFLYCRNTGKSIRFEGGHGFNINGIDEVIPIEKTTALKAALPGHEDEVEKLIFDLMNTIKDTSVMATKKSIKEETDIVIDDVLKKINNDNSDKDKYAIFKEYIEIRCEELKADNISNNTSMNAPENDTVVV